MDAAGVVDRLRAASVSITFAAGVAAWSGQDLDPWLREADSRLYADKCGARGQDGDDVPA